MVMTYAESIQYIEELSRLPFLPSSRVGLSRAAYLHEQIGNPHLAFRSVHVTGSAGKGSTTTMIGSILQSAGFRTGYFRSPHLESYTERITIGGEDISRASWERHFGRIWPAAERMRRNEPDGYDLGRPTLFEILFALASLHFAESAVEWVAAEVGLGGRLDATNLLQSDVAAITNVGLEHTRLLGKTVSAIAREKAAIIKPGAHAVTAAQDPEALEVISARAVAVGAPLLRVGEDVTVTQLGTEDTGQRLLLLGRDACVQVDLALGGTFQATNAATAFAVGLALQARGVEVDLFHTKTGLESARFPGRFEVISHRPPIILDGAHHPAAMNALADALRESGRCRVRLLFAAMDDKDVEAMAREIAPLAEQVTVTSVPDTPRSASTARMAAAFLNLGVPTVEVSDAEEALEQVVTGSGTVPAVVCGSLYLVGMARRALRAAPVS